MGLGDTWYQHLYTIKYHTYIGYTLVMNTSGEKAQHIYQLSQFTCNIPVCIQLAIAYKIKSINLYFQSRDTTGIYTDIVTHPWSSCATKQTGCCPSMSEVKWTSARKVWTPRYVTCSTVPVLIPGMAVLASTMPMEEITWLHTCTTAKEFILKNHNIRSCLFYKS